MFFESKNDELFCTTSLAAQQIYPNGVTSPIMSYETMVSPNRNIFYKLAGPKYNSKMNIVSEFIHIKPTNYEVKRRKYIKGIMIIFSNKLTYELHSAIAPLFQYSNIEYPMDVFNFVGKFDRKGILTLSALTTNETIQSKLCRTFGYGQFIEAEHRMKIVMMNEVYNIIDGINSE